jgi:hypothetical protein
MSNPRIPYRMANARAPLPAPDDRRAALRPGAIPYETHTL